MILFDPQKKYRALVTGASRGIGFAIANELSLHRIDIVEAPRAILDLSSFSSMQEFIRGNHMRDVNILVNNAGINILSEIESLSPDDWIQMIHVNTTAPLMLSQAAFREMRKKNWGRVVNISSVFGIVTKEKRAAYTATKAALIGFTKTSALEMASHGVLINAVCPGYVETTMTRKNNTEEQIREICMHLPLRRLAQPQEIASFVTFLCSEKNSYMTGQAVILDGGFTL